MRFAAFHVVCSSMKQRKHCQMPWKIQARYRSDEGAGVRAPAVPLSLEMIIIREMQRVRGSD